MKAPLERLRDELLAAQLELRRDPAYALAVIIAGAPTAGRSEIVNELLEWLDPKFVEVRAFHPPDRAERRFPAMHRYWRTLPARGRISFYFAGWYGEFFASALGETKRAVLRREAERIRRLEAMLTADRVRILKIYLAVDAKTQQSRLQKLRADKRTRWRVTVEDLWLAKRHKQLARAAARCMRATDQPVAPWRVIDGADEKNRLLHVARHLRDALTRKPGRQAASTVDSVASAPRALASSPAQCVSDEEYEHELEALQGRLARLVRRPRFAKRGLVLAFEGMDAAGKGGVIRRITQALDARQYRVAPVSAPSAEEALYPYLWRFWRTLPEQGSIAIYDRSWYGRVLVERVRGFASETDWRRAYDEIREFEGQLTEQGLIVAKFWLNVSEAEQLKRFEARNEDPLKRFKVDEEDWVNRRLFKDYQAAAIEMIARTHAGAARWSVIPADHKKTARLTVLRTVCEEIERALD